MARDIKKDREEAKKLAIDLLKVLDFSEYIEYCTLNNIPIEFL